MRRKRAESEARLARFLDDAGDCGTRGVSPALCEPEQREARLRRAAGLAGALIGPLRLRHVALQPIDGSRRPATGPGEVAGVRQHESQPEGRPGRTHGLAVREKSVKRTTGQRRVAAAHQVAGKGSAALFRHDRRLLQAVTLLDSPIQDRCGSTKIEPISNGLIFRHANPIPHCSLCFAAPGLRRLCWRGGRRRCGGRR